MLSSYKQTLVTLVTLIQLLTKTRQACYKKHKNVTNNVLAKFIEKLKYYDRVQLYDNKLYILTQRARNAAKRKDGMTSE